MTKKAIFPSGARKIRELAIGHGFGAEAADAIASIDVTMTRIRRSFARRELARTVMAQLDSDLEMAHLDVISAMGGFACENLPAGTEATVGFIAEQMNVHPSRASRLVADVVDRGYARRVASQQDSRRICLELTERGEAFVDSFRAVKWNALGRALGDWSEKDLVTFARLLDRFSGWSLIAFGDAAPQPAKQREKQEA